MEYAKIHRQAVERSCRVAEMRRWLHQHAELSFQEVETSAYIEKQLKALGGGLEISRPTKTSVMAVLRTPRPGPVLAVRADIDALPMQEESGLPYASATPGVMHSCGHDGHAAILLAAAEILTANAEQLCGELRFLFQHAEELPPGGAAEMVRAGVMEGVQEVYGLHLTSSLPTGEFGICRGALTSNTDGFTLTVKGKGGHSSMPEACVDPVVIGAQIVLALQGIVSRSVKPGEPVVLSVCQAEAGTAYNIIPGEMVLKGSVRTFSAENRAMVRRKIGEIAEGIAAGQGAELAYDFQEGYSSVVNDPALTDFAEEVIRDCFGPAALRPILPVMPGEDFSAFHQNCPGFFVELGAACPAKGITAPHHNPRYLLDEDALTLGVEYTAALLARRMEGPNGN